MWGCECLLFKRISINEDQKSLHLMHSLLDRMQVFAIDHATRTEALQTAYKFHLTFNDTTYLVEAKKTGKTLVTDDYKLAKAEKNWA
jgi:predicted nucleic acid-binding protein